MNRIQLLLTCAVILATITVYAAPQSQRIDEPTKSVIVLTEDGKSLGVAAITEEDDCTSYIVPAMVKLVPRETTLGIKDEHMSGPIGFAHNMVFMNPPGYGNTLRKVKLNPYWIGRYEVTLREFQKFLNDTGRKRETELIDGDKQVKPNRPVVGLYRRQAIEYCEWLSKKTGMKFRLPTEDEWEYAARSGYEQKPTPYGDEMPFKYSKHPSYKGGLIFPLKQTCNFNWDIVYGFLHDVGSYPPTRYHLYDMGGNVMEWTYHDYAPDIYRIKDNSWGEGLKVYGYIVKKEDFRKIYLGFRIVREP